MKRALRLAKKGWTSPNPKVGAVIVRNGQIVGEGFHPKAGEPHAEIFALNKAGGAAKGAVLYVNLEPCCHFGKTPPCTDAIINAGIFKVVAAIQDPNPEVSGKGLQILRNAGVETVVGVLESEARQLNAPFFKYITSGLPYFRLKMAMTLDGKIASREGDSRWVTGLAARRRVHRMRRDSDAILIGVGTLLKDDPELTVRLVKTAFHPARVVLDPSAKTPTDAKLFRTPGEIIIAVTKSAEPHRIRKLEEKGARILSLESVDAAGKLADLSDLAKQLAALGIINILVEGGGVTAAHFIQTGLIDSVSFFIAPKIIGGRGAPTPVEGVGLDFMENAIKLSNIRVRKYGEDICIEGDLKTNTV